MRILQKDVDEFFNTRLVLRPTCTQKCVGPRSKINKGEELGMKLGSHIPYKIALIWGEPANALLRGLRPFHYARHMLSRYYRRLRQMLQLDE